MHSWKSCEEFPYQTFSLKIGKLPKKVCNHEQIISLDLKPEADVSLYITVEM